MFEKSAVTEVMKTEENSNSCKLKNHPETAVRIPAILIVVLLLLALPALGEDAGAFYSWYLVLVLMGLAGTPVACRLFASFEDRGWFFAKVLTIAVTGYITWAATTLGLTAFTVYTCIASVALYAVFNYVFGRKTGYSLKSAGISWSLVLWEEALFLFVCLLWSYLIGYGPEAYETENFMDFGFIKTILRSETLPAMDIWFAPETMNYYYGGQYYTAFLIRLTFTSVNVSYNLARSVLAGLSFILPFSIVYNLLKDRLKTAGNVPVWGAVLAGCNVCFAGTLYYVVYDLVLPLFGYSDQGYMFWNATRYINCEAGSMDNTIHEFPCYSYIVGDLHAHVCNVPFVLLFIGLLYAWWNGNRAGANAGKRRYLSDPHILLLAVLLGIYNFTNYWDFIIYAVVCLGTIVISNYFRFGGDRKRFLSISLIQAAEVLIVSYLAALPYSMNFDSMYMGVGIARNHSKLYQYLVVWGLPVFTVLCFFVQLAAEFIRSREKKADLTDIFVAFTALCALGLIVIPELFYVRDIYEEAYARANTMFKLTYQAYIMFGMCMSYGIFRILVSSKLRLLKTCSALCMVLLILNMGYFGKAVRERYITSGSAQRQNLDATAYIETVYPADAGGIRWLDHNVDGVHIVLEADGTSYSDYCRVSAMTGLPTVCGWFTHERLWRNDVSAPLDRGEDIKAVYCADTAEAAGELLNKYGVEYIFVGSCEREKYGEDLNHAALLQLGEMVYSGPGGTYIIKVR